MDLVSLIILGLVLAIAFYMLGYGDGQRNGIKVMRDEFDEYRAIKGMGAES